MYYNYIFNKPNLWKLANLAIFNSQVQFTPNKLGRSEKIERYWVKA